MNDTSLPHSPTATMPHIERVRHELKRRELTVEAVENVTPNMLRITLSGDDLADFPSAAPDDHVKIFLAAADGDEPERRDYTPRRFDTKQGRLVLDFAVHEAGPATQWALDAAPGTKLSIGGPRGSAVVSGVKRWLLIGDETALPAIGRRIEEAGADETITVFATVEGPQEEQRFESKASVDVHYVHRPLSQAAESDALLEALETLDLKPETFVWVAAEAFVARAVRAHLVEKHGLPLTWLKAAGYWTKGQADTAGKIE